MSSIIMIDLEELKNITKKEVIIPINRWEGTKYVPYYGVYELKEVRLPKIKKKNKLETYE